MKKRLGLLLVALFVASSVATLSSCNLSGTSGESSNTDISSDDSSNISTDSSDTSSETATYTVTFDVAGGSEVAEQTVEEGATITKPTDPTKVGYTFAGWTKDGQAYDFTTAVSGNITLTATWNANDDTFYSVEVYCETVDGQFAKLSQSEVEDVQLVRMGTTDGNVDLTAEANEVVSTMAGFEIDATQSVLTGTINADGSTVLKIYISRKTYTLSFDGVTADPISVKYGTMVDFEALPAIPAQQDKISAWKLDDVTVSGDFEWTYAENKTINAVYIGLPRTVTFTANGATYATETVENNTIVVKPATDPEKLGYTFDGWYADGADAAFDFNTAIVADTELTAKFTANTYTLSFDANEGECAEESIVVTYDSTVSNLPVATKDGYDFVKWTIGDEVVTNETVWNYVEDKTAVADWKIQSFVVTFKIGEDTVKTVDVDWNNKVSSPANVAPGYDVAWDFDFETAITEDTTIVGTKTEKTIRFTADSTTYTGKSSAGVPVFDENGRYKVQLETDPADQHRLTLDWYFDLTVEDIEAFEVMGYASLDFDFNISLIGGASANGKTYSLLNGAKTITVEDQNQWIHISVTLDELAKYVTSGNGKFFDHTYVQYYPTIELKDMRLCAAKKTITFMDGETKVSEVVVYEGEKALAVTIPGYDVVWMNGDVAFDFDTAITEDITLTVGTKTEKTIRFTADSTTSTGKDSAGAPVFGENGRYKVTLETSSADNHKLSLKWYFDLTVEDIEAFKEMGYGTLEFDFNISLTGGQTANGKTYSLLNGAKTITVADQNQWIHISVTLDELAKYVTSGNGKFFEHTYVHYWPTIELKDMGLVVAKKMVTFMDGETKVAGVGVIEGEKVDVVSIPGYDVVWMNGDAEFDFDTAITEDITLTVGTKTEKTIRFTADSTTSTGKDSAGAPVFGDNGRYKVTLETSSSDKHKLSLKWYFDLTVEDIEAFKEMGYGTLEFDFNISLTGGQTANGKTYSLLNGAKTITVEDQNQWIHISVTLDELAKYVASGNGKFFEHTYVHYWPTIELKDMGLVKATTQA